jgi:cytidylate kinase
MDGIPMFRVLTVSREFGSGGGTVAQRVANRLSWNLIDKNLVDEIASRAKVDPDLARTRDERIDSWLHRVSRRALWSGGPEHSATIAPTDVFDAETMATLARNLIEDAYSRGQAVIVGRGAQCILQNRPDVFHVFIYAPMHDKVERVRERVASSGNIEELIRTTDRRRAEFVKFHFGCDWSNPHLYDAMICSKLGEDTVAAMIIEAMRAEKPA